ncbi:MAG TPA: hypothetical protein VFZ21_19550 [Gemmatimonadaceae bacterium]|nr:hypothetical protein [Gemmatimonadaceae bacterium]
MAFRSFRDSSGIEWLAWDVMPQSTERRRAQRRMRDMPVFTERRRAERRITMVRRPVLSHGFGGGWLCFQTRTERRRLAPIPGDWPACDDTRLENYCRSASVVPRESLRVGERELDLH